MASLDPLEYLREHKGNATLADFSQASFMNAGEIVNIKSDFPSLESEVEKSKIEKPKETKVEENIEEKKEKLKQVVNLIEKQDRIAASDERLLKQIAGNMVPVVGIETAVKLTFEFDKYWRKAWEEHLEKEENQENV